MSHHWSAAGKKSSRTKSAWNWPEFEFLIEAKIQPSQRLRLEEQFDISLREQALELVTERVQQPGKNSKWVVETALKDLRDGVAESAPPLPKAEVATRAMESVTQPSVGTIKRRSQLSPKLLNGLPLWVKRYPWLSDYILYCRVASGSEIPLDFLILTGLGCMSAAMGNLLRIDVWSLQNTVNLYGLLIGDAGMTRKGTALRFARTLVAEAFPDRWRLDGASREALESELKVLPYGLVVKDEFQEMVGGSDSGYKGDFRLLMNTLHNVSEYRTSFRNRGQTNIDYPAVTVLGGMTPSQFWKDADGGTFGAGLFSRLLVTWDTAWGEPTGVVDRELRDDVRRTLVDWLRSSPPKVPTVVTISGDDHQALMDWADELGERYPKFADAPIAARAAIHAMRVAVLLWACRERITPHGNIPSSDIDTARSYLEDLYLVASNEIETHMSKTPEGRQMKEILRLVSEQGGVMRKDHLLREMEIMGFKANQLFDTLEQRKDVLLDDETTDDGEKITWVRLTRDA